jgi:formylglycine-generating enzyme required for sulfatase activity
MGSDRHYPEEAPVQTVQVAGFWIDPYTVTNADFQRFVEDTGYITAAEQELNADDYPGALPELLKPGSLVFQMPDGPVELHDCRNWWEYVVGADWRHPEGPHSSIRGRERHPVVHVAYEDAQAYAAWAGKALPTEAEWEIAAYGGAEGSDFPWGDELMPGGRRMANTWLGDFPWQNENPEGHIGTQPVGSYPPNGYGIYDMVGNVWEWTCDWFAVRRIGRGGDPDHGYAPAMPQIPIPRKVIKGGSYLCAANYCARYRPAARSAEMIDSATCHLGFRCVWRPAVDAASGPGRAV